MSDPTAGTPTDPAQAANNAGTAPAAADGSEAASAKPVDPALAMAWKQKAERVNSLEKELAEERERRMRVEAERVQAQPWYDPQQQQAAQAWQRIQQDAAAGEPYAQMQLVQFQMTQRALVESQLASELMVVPDALRETVRNIVVQSGYSVGVADARKQAEEMSRGRQYDELSARLATLEEENKRLKAADASRPRASTAMAGGVAPDMSAQYDMTGSDYRAVLARGGPDALALKRAVDAGQKRVDWSG